MPNRKHGKKAQQSAATVLATSDVYHNIIDEISGASVSELSKIEKLLKAVADQYKQVEKNQNSQFQVIELLDKNMQNIVTTIEEKVSGDKRALDGLKNVDTNLAFIKKKISDMETKIPNIQKHLVHSQTSMPGDSTLKLEIQRLQKENKTLSQKLESANTEIRTLRDEFLMNLERQNETTLVIHGIEEEEGETTEDLEEKVNNLVSSTCNIPITCSEAFRVGKKGHKPRVTKVRWDNQKHCQKILEKHRVLPKGIYCNKDRPFLLREIKRKIREKAKELWASNIEYEYKDLGLIYDGIFHHYTEWEQMPHGLL